LVGDTTNLRYKQMTDGAAAFGQVTVNVTDRFRLTGGGRYSDDHKSASIFNFDNPGASVPFVTQLFPPTNLPDLKRTDEKFTWLAGAQYDVTQTVMAYAKAGTGFKDGGFNARASGNNSVVSFDPETSTTYEAGVKSTLFGRRLVLNADVYRMILKGFQDSTLNTLTGTGFIVANAGNRRVDGVEIDAQAHPIEPLSVTAALAYADGKYTSYREGQCPSYPGAVQPTKNTTPAGTCDFTGLTPSLSPEWKLSGSAEWRRPLAGHDDLEWFVGGDASYTSAQYLDTTLDPRSHQKSYTLVSARLGLESRDGWRLQLWAKNLFDQSYYVAAAAQPLAAFVSGGGTAGAAGFVGWYGAPRTFGIEASYRF
jgi:iron complex outermembrane receptor protein